MVNGLATKFKYFEGKSISWNMENGQWIKFGNYVQIKGKDVSQNAKNWQRI